MKQVEINFEAGLTEQFPTFDDCLRASVYGCGRAIKAIAADLDMSQSELSRKLADNPNDPVHFPADRLDELIAATKDYRPIYWLIEKFIEDAEVKRRRNIDEMAALIPKLQRMISECTKDNK